MTNIGCTTSLTTLDDTTGPVEANDRPYISLEKRHINQQVDAIPSSEIFAMNLAT